MVRNLRYASPLEDTMLRSRDRWNASFVGAVSFALLLSAAPGQAAGGEQTQNNAAMGSYLFKTYCATCHGTSARGDGPLAPAMNRKPANLTEIAKRNKGTYPRELVQRIIDGRSKVPGHGGPDMPVWGDAFMRTSDGATEETVRLRIQALVDYLETIQARDTQ